jgi:hypothetical protein
MPSLSGIFHFFDWNLFLLDAQLSVIFCLLDTDGDLGKVTLGPTFESPFLPYYQE